MSMVDITQKPEIYREAKARGIIKLTSKTINLIQKGKIEKGDPFQVAKVAAILAAKNTSMMIPLCHPIPLTGVNVQLKIIDDSKIQVETTVKTLAQTGVEMEALSSATTALLTIWDMTKKYEKDSHGQYPHTKILDIHVIRKLKAKNL